jgi:hypothetical protein
MLNHLIERDGCLHLIDHKSKACVYTFCGERFISMDNANYVGIGDCMHNVCNKCKEQASYLIDMFINNLSNKKINKFIRLYDSMSFYQKFNKNRKYIVNRFPKQFRYSIR